jgi:hypothetical protein
VRIIPFSGARSLLGVEDTKLYPVRGQVILAYAPNVNEFVTIFPVGEQLGPAYMSQAHDERHEVLPTTRPRQHT